MMRTFRILGLLALTMVTTMTTAQTQVTVTDRPTLAMLGVTPAHEQQLELDAHLCRIAARKGYIGTALSALRQALNQADRP